MKSYMRPILSILSILLLPLVVLAFPVFANQVAPDLSANFELGTDENDRMTVPVMVNGQGPFPFVIDTGSERTMISSELAARLDLQAAGSGLVHSISGIHKIALFQIDVLNVSGEGILDILAPAVSEARLGATGLLGLDSLRGSQVLFDIHRDVMSVRPASIRSKKQKRRSRSPRGTIVVTAKSLHGRLIFTDAELNGVSVRVVVDTGAEITVGNRALRKALRYRQRTEDNVDLIGVVGDRVAADLTKMRRLRLHGMTINGGEIAYSDAPVFAELGLDDEPAILLGMGTIRAFKQVAIDFPNRQVSFVLNPSVAPPLRWHCRATRLADPYC